MTDYATLEEFKERHSQIAGVDDDDLISACLTAASRAVDTYCGRRFYSDTVVSARTYHVTDPNVVDVDDFSTVTGLIVATDEGDDGTYETTWTISTHFYCEPVNGKVNGLEGFPFNRLVSTGVKCFPTVGYRPLLQVTAKWGWASVPTQVQQATLIKAASMYRRKDSPDGLLGGGDFGPLRVGRYEDPTYAELLRPFRRYGGTGMPVVA